MNKKTATIIISLLTVTAISLGALAYNESKKVEIYSKALEITHYHAFAELVTGMSELDTALQKSVYAKSPSVISALCTDIFGKAMTAQMALGSLPFSAEELEQTAGFISRVGDYAYTLSLTDDECSEEETETLRALSKSATLLADNFQKLQKDLSEGAISMEQLITAESQIMDIEEALDPATVGSGIRLIEGEFPEIPSLIYDGPFSEHIKKDEPKLLAGMEKITEEKAKEIAADFLGVEGEKLTCIGKSEGDIPCYYFSCDSVTIEVTQQGGAVLNQISSYVPETANLTADEAIKIAQTFLKERGYEDMVESYHMTADNICTINFAYSKDDIMYYSDLIKVSVALDRGTVTGFESLGYISSHSERDLPEIQVEREQAQELVSDELDIISHGLVVIPTGGQYEILCHEFVTSTEEGGQFIIYVNAQTGQQEKILILLEDENGSLTI